MDTQKIKKYPRLVAALIETFGFGPALATAIALFMVLVALAAAVWVVRSAPPRTLVLTSGPEGSTFQRYAESYRTLLATHGVTLQVRASDGSLDNLKHLQASGSDIDVGFVQGGLGKEVNLSRLVSLGSIAYQPLWVFYRGSKPHTRLSELSGLRIAVGAAGSGTRSLALALLAANGITGAPTTFLELDAGAAATALIDGTIDAVFMMGDSASMQTLRSLVRAPGVQIFNFSQADAYVRRFPYLNKMVLPEGSIDLGKNLPDQDVQLIGPTVELVARKGLNSALSDLLLEAAQEVHGKAGLLQRRGEFPAPLEHEFKISEDAQRYYKSGRSFLYRMIPSFWIANLINRILVAIVPLMLVFIPAVRLFPVLYRWSVQSRIYRHYRPLLRLEREGFGPLSRERVQELLKQVDEIEQMTSRVKVPASYAYQFYELRVHLAFVRRRLEALVPMEEALKQKPESDTRK
ncbi:MAG: TAXI family TRAP transporter solute-binding subunit [Lacunisphaera sp.]